MESEQRTERTEREITYQVGWKRGKITLNNGKPSAGPGGAKPAAKSTAAAERLTEWSLRYVWKPAGAIPDGGLRILLAAFPLIAFALSLWLVYQLSVHPY